MSHIPHTVADRACIDFLNSRWTDHRGSGRVNDDLQDPTWRRWFLARWGYELAAGAEEEGLPALTESRTALRTLLECWGAGHELPAGALGVLARTVSGVRGRLAVDGAGGRLEIGFRPARRDWSWVLTEVAGSAAQLMAAGEGRRLKSCANPGCSWLFYDGSHNLSRRWCDPAACGNLVKVRLHRARRAEAGL